MNSELNMQSVNSEPADQNVQDGYVRDVHQGYAINTQSGYEQGMQPGYVQNVQYGFEPDMKAHRKFFSRVGMSYFMFFVVATVLQLGIILAVRLMGMTLPDTYIVLILLSIIPMYLFAAPATWLMMKKLPVCRPGRNKWGAGMIIAGFFVTYFAMYAGNFIGVAVGTMIETIFPWARAATNEVQDLASEGDILVNLFIMVMIGPVVEELLFRKLLIDRVRAYGELTAVLLSGIMFGLFHGNITQGAYATLIGFVLAFVYVKTGDIRITIGYHMVINFFGGIIAVLLNKSIDLDIFMKMAESENVEELMGYFTDNFAGLVLFLGYSMLAVISMIAGLVLLIIGLVMGKVRFSKGPVVLPAGRRFATICVNFGMIAFLASCIFEVVMSFFS